MKGMEYDPERGQRCTECFDMRMERTALYAHENSFHAIATTNATSRWKDAEQVDASGFRAAKRYDGLKYWCQNWQSDEMTLRKYEISAKERFYKQGMLCTSVLRDIAIIEYQMHVMFLLTQSYAIYIFQNELSRVLWMFIFIT